LSTIRILEKLILALILGLIAPILGLLLFWWGALVLLPEAWVAIAALSGLALGLGLDALFLRKAVRVAYTIKVELWAAIHLFYSMGLFGMFMGVPVVNALLSLPAGFVVGGRLAAGNADESRVRQAARRTAWFTSGVLFLVCVASACVALDSPSTPADLRGMLRLGFEVTQGMVVGLIVVGGMGLLAFNWVLTLVTVRFAHTFLLRK